MSAECEQQTAIQRTPEFEQTVIWTLKRTTWRVGTNFSILQHEEEKQFKINDWSHRNNESSSFIKANVEYRSQMSQNALMQLEFFEVLLWINQILAKKSVDLSRDIKLSWKNQTANIS